ncbi:NIPSNAP family protein [Labrys wisconsinensis]|uniref:Quinol monooxygenase YgiN n=1 Tax=Labrys wisconsinensis TaxID=425677 RepID=A0ABU0JKB6_9HYPH|nr:NIPSNAP family protein [Labrys wisconsinensis]MDQ0474030.1 quinol monooxygenase YgiN [Labrys wisconsinensis]
MSESGEVFELRRYRLRPGRREALIAVFEREFVETQEAAGMRLHGFYRDAADPDAFVWMRSFAGMAERAAALAAFYGGEAWRRWGPEANATMVNSDNVLLLKASSGAPPFSGDYGQSGVVTVSTCSLAPGREVEFAESWERRARPLLEAGGARIDATFVTERSPNSFPRLPVREGETVFVWVSAFPDDAALSNHRAGLAQSAGWTGAAFPWLDGEVWRPLETMTLAPTRRSRHAW